MNWHGRDVYVRFKGETKALVKKVGSSSIAAGVIGMRNRQNEPRRVCRRLFGLSYAATAGCSSVA